MRLRMIAFYITAVPSILYGQEFQKSRPSVIKAQRLESAVDIYKTALKYKNGDGVPIDYQKAFRLFQTAADMGDAQSLYATAYCYYKGLGIQQNYEIAAERFAILACEGRDNAMYFYGLCLKNGYGLTRDRDSARYWLKKAADLGYNQAVEELKLPRGENSNDSAVSLLDKISRSGIAGTKPLNQFTLEQPHIPSEDLIEGTFNGYVLRYDWSGAYLISSKPVKISLEKAADSPSGKRSIKGTWQEKGEAAVPLRAELIDDSVIFTQTQYEMRDHYSWNKAITYDFKSANLNLHRIGDSVYLVGNLELFSPQRNEPSKPVFLALARTDALLASLSDSIAAAHTGKDSGESAGAPRIKGATVYPNPFSSNFTVEFILTEGSSVAVQLLNMSGIVVYKKPEEFLKNRKYSILVSPGRIPGGMYIIRLIDNKGGYTDLKVIRK